MPDYSKLVSSMRKVISKYKCKQTNILMTHIKETEKDNIILKVGHLISSNFSK
jgi:cobalamin biosynthesis Co2+ chelatase CbiK